MTKEVKEVKACVGSLHIHPKKSMSGPDRELNPMTTEQFMDIDEKGIVGERSAFRKGKRSVTLFDRETIQIHAEFMTKQFESEHGVCRLNPGVVRSNIETVGIDLCKYLHHEIHIGRQVVLYISQLREPCFKMNKIYPRLSEVMIPGKQGVIADIVHIGRIYPNDTITIGKKR